MSNPEDRAKDSRRQPAHTADSLAALGRAAASAKADNDATAADWWTSGGAKANQYREPMASVKTIAKGSKGPSGTVIIRGSYRDN
jgi:hypothetical protein